MALNRLSLEEKLLSKASRHDRPEGAMLNELLGRIAYEAAASATGCSQPWDEANKAKWIAAAEAVAVRFAKGDGYFFVFHHDDPMLKMVPDGTTVILQRKVLRSNG